MKVEQEELYKLMMTISNDNTASDIKGAAVNLLIAAICAISPNVDEAIIQWNELSNFFEQQVRTRYSKRDATWDMFAANRLKLNGWTR